MVIFIRIGYHWHILVYGEWSNRVLNISSVLIIYKKSVYQLYGLERKDPQFLSHLGSNEQARARIIQAHEDNEQTVKAVISAVSEAGIPHQLKYRARPGGVKDHSLVITIGGDGTLLDASHAVENTPILGVNSAPDTSVGHFCAATGQTIQAALEAIQADEYKTLELARMSLSIDGEKNPNPILNDILFSHAVPAAATRFELELKGKAQQFKCSGIWVSSASGSTGAMHSAGGTKMPPQSKNIQYMVREPYGHDAETQQVSPHGIHDGELSILSLVRQGMVYLDGHRLKQKVGYGQRITLSTGAPSLNLFRPPGEEE